MRTNYKILEKEGMGIKERKARIDRAQERGKGGRKWRIKIRTNYEKRKRGHEDRGKEMKEGEGKEKRENDYMN